MLSLPSASHALTSSPRACALRSLLPRERARQPVETLVEAIARRRTGRLDVPIAVTHLLKAKLIRHLGSGHRLRKILLVCKDEHNRVPELILPDPGGPRIRIFFFACSGLGLSP